MASKNKSTSGISEYLASIGREGGKNSRKNLSNAKKTAIAKKAAKTRWDKQRAKRADGAQRKQP